RSARISANSIRLPWDQLHRIVVTGASIRAQGWINPADIAVGPAVDHIQAPMSSMTEHHNFCTGDFELADSLLDTEFTQVLGGLGNDRGGVVLVQIVQPVRRAKHGILQG